MGDWVVWGACFLVTIAPSILRVTRKSSRPDMVEVLTSFVFPSLSLMAVSLSYYVGGTLLVGSGFLAAYTLVSRSERLLNMKRVFVIRLLLTEVFAFMALAAVGGVISILLWQDGVFAGLLLGYDSQDLWLSMLKLDMELFYLARPILLTLLAGLGAAAIVALFREPFQLLAQWMTGRIRKKRSPDIVPVSPSITRERGKRSISLRGLPPYLLLVASVALGFAITIYPYAAGKAGGPLGSDMWFYQDRLIFMNAAPNPLLVLENDRGLSMLLLFVIMKLAHLDVESILKLAPALFSALLAVSAFVFMKEGTGQSWLAGSAALLSVVSAQTSLGMGAGILANWFSLSLANFMFALVLRWVRLRSWLAVAGGVVFSMFLLGSYAYMWVAAVAMLMIALVATLLSFRSQTRQEWKHESASLGAVLVGCLVLPVIVAWIFLVPLLGGVPAWFDAGAFLSQGWGQLVSRVSSQPLPSAASALEEAFDFAGNRVDLPFLTILSIVGLLDPAWKGSFRRLVAAMVLLPIVVAAISPSLYDTWRGLYVVPMYFSGALGVASITRLVNGREASWRSPSRLAFAGTFFAYVFLSHLSYSLRAVELLILAAREA
jgi:hypothetical protein